MQRLMSMCPYGYTKPQNDQPINHGVVSDCTVSYASHALPSRQLYSSLQQIIIYSTINSQMASFSFNTSTSSSQVLAQFIPNHRVGNGTTPNHHRRCPFSTSLRLKALDEVFNRRCHVTIFRAMGHHHSPTNQLPNVSVTLLPHHITIELTNRTNYAPQLYTKKHRGDEDIGGE